MVEPPASSRTWRDVALPALLEVQDLKKWFPLRRTLEEVLRGERRFVRAVDGVSFALRRGEILALVGESGCGKTTTGRLITGLLEPTSGSVCLDREELSSFEASGRRGYSRRVQMIFQDPYGSMNPRFRIRDVLEEPLLIHRVGAREQRDGLIRRALEEVRLSPVEDFWERFPHMLSGGQRQRAATARALILEPELLVADEPVSMIDLSTRAEILTMMGELRDRRRLSFLYITHDISTARYFANRIAVMYLGRIVEIGTPDDVVERPAHPYTRALIAAVCEPSPGRVGTLKALPIKDEVPSAAEIPRGCRFHPRCIHARPACGAEPEPELEVVAESHRAACLRWREI